MLVDLNKMIIIEDDEFTLFDKCYLNKLDDDKLTLLLDKVNYARDNCRKIKSDKSRRFYFAQKNKSNIKKDLNFTETYKVDSIIHTKKNTCYNCHSEYFQIYKRETIASNTIKLTCICKNCKEIKLFVVDLSKK